MRIVTLTTPAQKAKGLIGMSPIPPDILWVFPDTAPGSMFHSQGVRHPFEIVFLSKTHEPLLAARIQPPNQVVHAPQGTAVAVESAVGTLSTLTPATLKILLGS